MPSPSESFDDKDAALMDQLRIACEAQDPVPPGLAEWITVALTIDDIDVQMVRLTGELAATPELVTRGDDDGASTITFENNDLTVMLRIEERVDGQLRLDGWVAPAAEHDVEIRTGDQTLTTRADTLGRFAFDTVPRGLAHVVLRAVEGAPEGRRTTITQAVVL